MGFGSYVCFGWSKNPVSGVSKTIVKTSAKGFVKGTLNSIAKESAKWAGAYLLDQTIKGEDVDVLELGKEVGKGVVQGAANKLVKTAITDHVYNPDEAVDLAKKVIDGAVDGVSSAIKKGAENDVKNLNKGAENDSK